MAAACCAALSDCQGDAACLGCVNGADSSGCDANDTTHARVEAYLTCRGGACETTCIGTTGDCQGALDGLVADACQTCLEESCCSEVGDCQANDSCWNDCFVTHVEEKCEGDPDGHALYHALGSCYSANCSTECQ